MTCAPLPPMCVERGSSFWTEFSGGMTTFFAMCYIMVLNGVIIGGGFNTGIPTSGVFFATALASGIFTTLMGLAVNVPVALAPGMGLNGYVTGLPASHAHPASADFQILFFCLAATSTPSPAACAIRTVFPGALAAGLTTSCASTSPAAGPGGPTAGSQPAPPGAKPTCRGAMPWAPSSSAAGSTSSSPSR